MEGRAAAAAASTADDKSGNVAEVAARVRGVGEGGREEGRKGGREKKATAAVWRSGQVESGTAVEGRAGQGRLD